MKRSKKAQTAAVPEAPQRGQAELEADLIASVHAHAKRLRALTPSEVAARAHALGAELACKGDAILFQTRDTEEVLDLYAEALACLALGIDGVEAMGVQFGGATHTAAPTEPPPVACLPAIVRTPAPQGQLDLFGGAP